EGVEDCANGGEVNAEQIGIPRGSRELLDMRRGRVPLDDRRAQDRLLAQYVREVNTEFRIGDDISESDVVVRGAGAEIRLGVRREIQSGGPDSGLFGFQV